MAIAPQRVVGVALAAVGLLAIAAATLLPVDGGGSATAAWCVICGDFGTSDFLANVALFVPLGLGLRLAGLTRRRALALVTAGTLAIELLQLHVIQGRDASLGDLLANALGGAIGMALAERWRAVVLPDATVARRLARAGAVVVVMVAVGTQWAFRASLPDTEYFGQLAPSLDGFDVFRGTLVSATVGGRPLAQGPLPVSERVRSALLRGGAAAEIIAAGPTEGIAPIVAVADRAQRDIVMLAQHRGDFLFRIRTRASDLRLHRPWLRVAAALAAADATSSEVPIAIAGGVAGPRWYAHVDADGRRLSAELAPSPGHGWTLFLPGHVALTGGVHPASLLWLAALLLPLGFWAGRAAYSGRAQLGEAFGGALLPAAAIALGLGAVPPLLGFPVPPWPDWIAAAAGAVVGWCAALALGRRSPKRPSAAATPEA